MSEATRNPMNAWVCCGAAITGPHSIGCIYGKPMPPPTPPRGTGEEAPPSDTQSARQPGDPCDRGAVWAELTTLRARLAAAEGERDAALKAVDVTPFTEEIRRLAALVAATPDALTAAERRGAERALRWAGDNPVSSGGLRDLLGADADDPRNQWRGYIMRGMATLFPEAPDALAGPDAGKRERRGEE